MVALEYNCKASRPGRFIIRLKITVPTEQEAKWAPASIWMFGEQKNLTQPELWRLAAIRHSVKTPKCVARTDN
jgi:hypothetical protein